jgi:hypothetical protein
MLDRLEIKSSSGVFGFFFGLPFAGMGTAFLVAALTGAMQSEDGSQAPLFFVVPFCLVFITIGLSVMLGRAGTVLDKTAGTVTSWWGLLVPFKRTEKARLEEITWVAIRREVRRSKNSSYTVYPVYLLREEGEAVSLEEPREYEAARARAEEVAKFLDLGTRDETGETPVVREAGTLDETLAERLQRTGEMPEVADPPPDCRVRHEIRGDEAVFHLPAAGMSIIDYVQVAFGLVFAGIASAFAAGPLLSMRGEGTEEIIFSSIFALFALPFLVVGLSFAVKPFLRARRREEIVVSPQGLTLIQHGVVRTRERTIPASELEELEIQTEGPGGRPAPNGKDLADAPPIVKSILGGLMRGSITARSDRQNLSFGRGLTPAELQWLHGVAHLALATG